MVWRNPTAVCLCKLLKLSWQCTKSYAHTLRNFAAYLDWRCRLAEELSTELGAMTERLLRRKEAAGSGADQRQGGAPEEVEG